MKARRNTVRLHRPVDVSSVWERCEGVGAKECYE